MTNTMGILPKMAWADMSDDSDDGFAMAHPDTSAMPGNRGDSHSYRSHASADDRSLASKMNKVSTNGSSSSAINFAGVEERFKNDEVLEQGPRKPIENAWSKGAPHLRHANRTASNLDIDSNNNNNNVGTSVSSTSKVNVTNRGPMPSTPGSFSGGFTKSSQIDVDGFAVIQSKKQQRKDLPKGTPNTSITTGTTTAASSSTADPGNESNNSKRSKNSKDNSTVGSGGSGPGGPESQSNTNSKNGTATTSESTTAKKKGGPGRGPTNLSLGTFFNIDEKSKKKKKGNSANDKDKEKESKDQESDKANLGGASSAPDSDEVNHDIKNQNSETVTPGTASDKNASTSDEKKQNPSSTEEGGTASSSSSSSTKASKTEAKSWADLASRGRDDTDVAKSKKIDTKNKSLKPPLIPQTQSGVNPITGGPPPMMSNFNGPPPNFQGMLPPQIMMQQMMAQSGVFPPGGPGPNKRSREDTQRMAAQYMGKFAKIASSSGIQTPFTDSLMMNTTPRSGRSSWAVVSEGGYERLNVNAIAGAGPNSNLSSSVAKTGTSGAELAAAEKASIANKEKKIALLKEMPEYIEYAEDVPKEERVCDQPHTPKSSDPARKFKGELAYMRKWLTENYGPENDDNNDRSPNEKDPGAAESSDVKKQVVNPVPQSVTATSGANFKKRSK